MLATIQLASSLMRAADKATVKDHRKTYRQITSKSTSQPLISNHTIGLIVVTEVDPRGRCDGNGHC
jgi:hypothetical protein